MDATVILVSVDEYSVDSTPWFKQMSHIYETSWVPVVTRVNKKDYDSFRISLLFYPSVLCKFRKRMV